MSPERFAMSNVTFPTFAQIRQLAEIPEDVLSVYISGSITSGWGHANSDLDVFVIVGRPYEGRVDSTKQVDPLHPALSWRPR
jgi:predicted nucleotidyltransferase